MALHHFALVPHLWLDFFGLFENVGAAFCVEGLDVNTFCHIGSVDSHTAWREHRVQEWICDCWVLVFKTMLDGVWYELLIPHVRRASLLDLLASGCLLPLGLVALSKEVLNHWVQVDHVCDVVRLLTFECISLV